VKDHSVDLKKRTLKNSLFSLLGFLWPLLLLFFSIPYFIYKLGNEKYGIWVLVMSTVGAMGVLNFGLGDTIIKFVSEYSAKKDVKMVNRIIGNSFFIYSIISAFAVVAGFFLLPTLTGFIGIKRQHSDLAIFIMRVAVVGFAINLFIMNALAIFKALQRYDLSSNLTIAITTMRIFGMMVLLYLGFGLKGMVFAYIGSLILGFILIYIFLRKNVPDIRIKLSFEIEIMRKIVGFSFYSFLINIASIIRHNAGNIIVGRYLGASYVPYFSVPFQISSQVLNSIGSLTTVLFPLFSSLKGENNMDKTKSVFVGASKLTAIVGFGIGTFLFLYSRTILNIWISPEFASVADLPFRILIISFLFALTAAVSYFFLMGSGRVKITALIQGLSTLLILFLGLILVPEKGIVGISIAYAVPTAALIIYVYFAAKNLWTGDWLGQVFRIYSRSVISLFLATVLFVNFGRAKISTIAHLSLFALLFGLILLFFNFLIDRDFFWKYIRTN